MTLTTGIITTLPNMHWFFALEAKKNPQMVDRSFILYCTPRPNFWNLITKYFPVLDGIIYSYIPSIAIITCAGKYYIT